MRYVLDEAKSPVGISLWYPGDNTWTDYHFIKNLQGDVLEVYKVSDQSLVASYTYDSWGNILSKSGSLATINPFRYRSYYFDEQTWFYYLQSRYYDPAIGRFLNADIFTSTGQGILGYNMFAYCNNNPVIGYDPFGCVNWGGVAVGLGIAILAVTAVAATIATAGAASPLLATVGSCVGTAVSTALLESAIVTTVGAISETPVVYDTTVVVGNERYGGSVVYDFKNNTSDPYLHIGKQNHYDFSVNFGSGFVYNYSEPGDYAGEFVDTSYSTSYKGATLGVDVCTSPDNFNKDGFMKQGTSAALLTAGIGTAGFGNRGPLLAYDYYYWCANNR